MMWLKRQMDRDAGFPDITQNPVGTSQLYPQVLTNPDPNVSPVIPRDLLSWQGLGATRGPVTADTAAQNTARALMGMDMALGFAGQATPVKGIKAYHGSPHSFDRFDMIKIGTGEGAQAYGHGLYFAGKEKVAKQYRDMLRQNVVLVDGAPIPQTASQEYRAMAEKLADGETVDRLRKFSEDYLRKVEAQPGPYSQYTIEQERNTLAALDELAKRTVSKSPGHMYEVALRTSPERLLDWDKPLSQQPAGVREALRSAWDVRKSGAPIPKWLAGKTGADIENALSTQGAVRLGLGNSPVSASRVDTATRLRDAGLDGIQYLDAGSRRAGEGSRNYVMFDDKLIDILRKYGLFGLGLTGAAGETARQFAPEGAQ